MPRKKTRKLGHSKKGKQKQNRWWWNESNDRGESIGIVVVGGLRGNVITTAEEKTISIGIGIGRTRGRAD